VEPLAFLGAGRIATALIRSFLRLGVCSRAQIVATHHDPVRAGAVAKSLGIRVLSSNAEATAQARLVFLCVRPDQMAKLLDQIGASVRVSHIFVSLAVGVPLRWIRDRIRTQPALLHVHPPVLALVGVPGMSFLACDDHTPKPAIHEVKHLFESLGPVAHVSELEMDRYAVFAGCAPAYLARVAEQWCYLAREFGIPEERAIDIVTATITGVAAAVRGSHLTLQQIQDQIATPGGVTATGLAQLEAVGVREMLRCVAKASLDKIHSIREEYR